MPKRRADDAASMATPTPPEGIVRVKLGSGMSHCFYCDTLIAKDAACVERVWYHQGGVFSRNKEEKRGVCVRGVAPESAHAQCAWRLDTRPQAQPVSCAACGCVARPGRRVVNYIGKTSERCSETSPLFWCFGCAKDFMDHHRPLLDGHVGAAQMQQGVAWVKHRPLAAPADLQQGCGLPPTTHIAKDKADYLAVFRASSAVAEALAVQRHRELQTAILAAMRQDAQARKQRARPTPPSTPIEEGFKKRARCSSDSPLDREALQDLQLDSMAGH
jgi:hypothetical protein